MESGDKKTRHAVSVVIPLYNKAPYISATLESVLQQTYSDFEIIVVDDGSTDGSAEKVRPYQDRIRYRRQENQGPSVARNLGIELSEGRYVSFLDADDRWLPEKLEKQVAFLEAHPGIMWCATNYWSVWPDRSRTPGPAPADETVWRTTPDWFEASLRGEHSFLTSTLMVRRSVFRCVGTFDERIPAGQDSDLFWRIGREFPESGYCRQPLVEYARGVAGCISSRGMERSRGINRILVSHVGRSLREDGSDSYRRYMRDQCIDHFQNCIARGFPECAAELVEQVPREWFSARHRAMLALASIAPTTVRRLAEARLSLKRLVTQAPLK